MEPEDFQQLRMEAKQAEDNLKFLTEEADAFTVTSRNSSSQLTKKLHSSV